MNGAFVYPCNELDCSNKGSSGPRDEEHCLFCNAFFKTATSGYLNRRYPCSSHRHLLPVYELVDALGAKKNDNHLVYMLFRALHNATVAVYGKSFGKLHELMTHWIAIVPTHPWGGLCGRRQCRKWCGKDAPEGGCDSSCTIAASYLRDIYEQGDAESLELAQRILDAFREFPGYARKKGYNVCTEIMGTDPMSCAGAGQYNRKVCHGIEISLMSRFDAWRREREMQMECYQKDAALPL